MKRLKTLFILFGIIVFAGTPFMVQADQISPNPNSGTITVTGSDYNSFVPFDNNLNGVINIKNAGSLTNNGALNNNGTLTNETGGMLINNIGATLNNYGDPDNVGSHTLTNNGTLHNYGTLTNIGKLSNWNGGILRNFPMGTLNINGTMFDSPFNPGGTNGNLENYGTLNINSGGTLHAEEGKWYNYGTLNINTGGTLDMFESTLTNYGLLNNIVTINNYGILNHNYDTLNNTSGGTLNNNGGTLNIEIGTYHKNDGATLLNNGVLNNKNGGTLNIGSGGTLTNHGVLNNDAGSTMITNTGGNFTNYGSVAIQGPFALTNLAVVDNYGLFKATNTTVTIDTLNNYGTYESDPSINYFQALINYGTIKGGAGDEFHIGASFMNYGILDTNLADLFFGSGSHIFWIGGAGSRFSFDDLFLPFNALLDLEGRGAYLHVNTLHVNSLSQITGLEYLSYNNLVPTPEPGSLLLLGFGLMGLAGVRRKIQE